MTRSPILIPFCITEDTIKSHLEHIRAKLDARNTTHAVVIALRRGLI